MCIKNKTTMNFEDRLSLEYMINPGLYQKYQKNIRDGQKQEFQQKKAIHAAEIEQIVSQLLSKNSNAAERLISPRVIHSFEEFVKRCIEDFEEEAVAADKLEYSSSSDKEECEDDADDLKDTEDDEMNELTNSNFHITEANFDENGYYCDDEEGSETEVMEKQTHDETPTHMQSSQFV